MMEAVKFPPFSQIFTDTNTEEKGCPNIGQPTS